MKIDFNTKQTKHENEPQNLFVLLSEALETGFEWLLARENGAQSTFKRSEIEVIYKDGKVFLECLTGEGTENWHVISAQREERKLLLELSNDNDPAARPVELIPRITAADLLDSIKTARLEMAARIAEIAAKIAAEIAAGTAAEITAGKIENCRIAGVRLSRGIRAGEYGGNAQILLQVSRNEQIAVFAPVAGKMNNPESFLVSALSWFAYITQRAKKNRIEKLWLICGKKNLAKLKKIIALLKPSWPKHISLFQFDPEHAEIQAEIREVKIPEFRNLWREKPRKIKLPEDRDKTDLANEIIALDPQAIDITYSAHGENLRFHGLPFLRVRSLPGKEKAWFGSDGKKQILDETNGDDLLELISELKEKRGAPATNKDHYFYRASPEHWLESILRRDITQLDANLILSPIYQQFRVSAEQVDLLALRKDGRLVVIELKVSPNREMIFQAANYWRLIELQRRSGNLQKAKAFGDKEIADEPALVYLVAPALSFHRDSEFWAGTISSRIQIYRYDLHENWRENINVLQVKRIGTGF